MNYYKRHLGDYARDAGHLGALEHGIYNLLIDWYYANECPIPDAKACRIGRVPDEKVRPVLEEFFKLGDSGWIHSRIDREIAAYHAKAKTNQEIARSREETKRARLEHAKSTNRARTVDEPCTNGHEPCDSGEPSHKPLATSHKEDKSKSAAEAAQQEFVSSMWAQWKALPRSGGGAFINKLMREFKPDTRVLEAMERTLAEPRADPKAFVIGILNAGNDQGGPRDDPENPDFWSRVQ